MAVDEGYRAFIKESLINPIRSVLIVDDDYPTIDELLGNAVDAKHAAATTQKLPALTLAGDALAAPGLEQVAEIVAEAAPVAAKTEPEAYAIPGRAKEWETAPEMMKAVIDHFRSLLLLVDVHDGSDIETGTAKLVDRHLHQSDLLILDYHLDETETGDKAIEIARAVASNDHFNMIVVNTRHTLSQVFEDMLLGLLSPLDCFDDDRREQGEAVVGKVEGDVPDAAQRICTAIGAKQFMHIVKHGAPALRDAIQGKGIFGEFKAECERATIPIRDFRLVLIWALAEFQSANRARMANDQDIGSLDWNEQEPYWIRSDRLFMAFSQKKTVTEPLEILLDALCCWAPPPSRLILAKFRAEMEAKGVSGETKAIGDKLATAYWYLTLLKAEDLGRRTLIEDSISRHAEQLIDDIAQNVHNFADRLSAADRGVGAAGFTKRVADRFAAVVTDIETQAASFAANAVACSTSPRGWHLRTGHVFEMDGSIWVCLTPICDMVPGQKRAGHRGEVGQRKPFMAVKLHLIRPVNYNTVDVNSNNYLFLKIERDIKVFSLLENSGAEEQPHWYMFYAEQNGQIDPKEPFPLSRLRDIGEGLMVEKLQAKLVSELRYEYAINLMQKLGTSLTRVGLDFTI